MKSLKYKKSRRKLYLNLNKEEELDLVVLDNNMKKNLTYK